MILRLAGNLHADPNLSFFMFPGICVHSTEKMKEKVERGNFRISFFQVWDIEGLPLEKQNN